MSTLDSKDFGLKIYNRFPPKYIEDDESQSYALKRYLESLADGGFSHIIDDTNKLLSLVNPNTIDAKYLPILYKQFGLEVFNGIPENYLRYLLPKLGDAWSQKGSLTIVEFITSSLSGVKVSSEITYDEKGDPYIKVFLEMDYNIGDYFPDAEQFIRLLEIFLPFYVDKTLVYSYLFYESQVVSALEGSLMDISDLKKENVSFKAQKTEEGEDLDTHKESISFVCNVEAKIGKDFSDIIINNINTSIEEELVRVRPFEELLTGNISLSYSENAGIYIRGRKIDDNAVFAEATFGKSIFAKEEDFADVTEDKIIINPINISPTLEDEYYTATEQASLLSTSINTFTNNIDNTLNGSFYTNTISNICFDIITMSNGEKSYIIHY